jgi:flavodoxin I
MKVLIVFDSFFGNTKLIAEEIGAALGTPEVSVVHVSEVGENDLDDVDVLFVGSPTRAFRPTPAIQNWLRSLTKDRLRGIEVAAFDTRIAVGDIDSRVLPVLVNIFGYAAEPIEMTLIRKGGIPALPPIGFYVTGSEGPLKDGELQRARVWAAQVAVPA